MNHSLNLVTLNNGIKLLTVTVDNFPLSISSFWVRAGSRKDPDGKTGLAHFFEHLLCTRTKKIPERQKRLIEIEKQGLFFSAFTSVETANYYYIHQADKTREAIELLIDGFQDSLIRTDDLEEERQIILDEERLNRNDPSSYIWRIAYEGLWPKSKMGNGFYGNQDSIGKITIEDFNDFYTKYYTPQNAVFVLINPNIDDLSLCKDRLENFTTPTSPVINHLDDLGVKKDIVFEKRDIENYHLSLCFLTCPGVNYKDRLILELVKSYLASGWISSLITQLRIKNKFTYWVNGDSLNLEDTGFLRFSLSTDTNHLEKVIEIFEKEIVSLKTKTVSNSVLNWHKTKYQSDLIRNSLRPEFLLSWYGWDIATFNQKPLTIVKHLNDLSHVSVSDIQRVAQKYFKAENFSLALLGPRNPIKKIPNF